MTTDLDYMKLALELAAGGRYTASPNPMVGAVIVRDGEVVGRGFHKKPGLPHAEVLALAEAGEKAQGATLYITLEPCSHYGRTGPCCVLLAPAGIKRVVVASLDPDRRVAGAGIKHLQEEGLEVQTGLLEREALRLNERYVKHRLTGMPFITLKAALTLDGKLAARTGDSKWITCEEARRAAHLLRAENDAVLVGVGTVVADDPELTCRVLDDPDFDQPARIVVDPTLRAPLDAKVFSPLDGARRLVLCSEEADLSRMAAFQERGIELLPVPETSHGRLALEPALARLASEELTSLLVEGGGETNAAFISQGFGDRIWFAVAPRLLGGRKAPTPVEGEGFATVAEALNLSDVSVVQIGTDFIFEGYLFGREPACSLA